MLLVYKYVISKPDWRLEVKYERCEFSSDVFHVFSLPDVTVVSPDLRYL